MTSVTVTTSYNLNSFYDIMYKQCLYANRELKQRSIKSKPETWGKQSLQVYLFFLTQCSLHNIWQTYESPGHLVNSKALLEWGKLNNA